MVGRNEISFLKRHLGATKEDILKAVAMVGNKLERIELYLLQQVNNSRNGNEKLGENNEENSEI